MASWASGFKPSSKSKTSSGARARAAAKSRSSGGSSSGSSSGNAFLDTINKAKEQGQSKMDIIAPNYKGPGGSSNGGGSSTQIITPQQIEQVQGISNQQNLQTELSKIESRQSGTDFLIQSGIYQGQSSNNLLNPDTIIEKRKKDLEDRQMSVATPDLSNVDVKDLTSRGSKNILGRKGKDYIEPKVVEEILNQRSTQILLEARDTEVGSAIDKQSKIKTQEINTFVSDADSKLNNYVQVLQEDVNSGRISADAATKKLESYQKDLNKNIDKYVNSKNDELAKAGIELDKKWWDERGQYIDKASGRIIGSYRTLNILKTANIPNVAVAVGIGVATGGVIAGGLGVVGAVAGAKTAAVVGGGLLYGGVGLGVVSAGGATYSLSKQYSAGEITKGEFFATLAVGGVFAGATIAGAMAGGLAVKAVTNYSSLKPSEQKVAERIINRQDSIKVDTVRGTVTESQIKLLRISSTEKATLLREIRAGNSIEKVSVKINNAGLSPEELAVAKKLNLRGSGYQVVSSSGKSVTGVSSYNIKTGRGVSRLNPQRTKEITSLFSGTSSKGSVSGIKVSEIRTPQKRGLFRYGDKPALSESRVEFIKGKGNVKYYKQGNTVIRREYSKGTSKLIRADVYDSKGNWVRSDIGAPTELSKSLKISKLILREAEVSTNFPSDTIISKNINTFRDVKGTSLSGKQQQNSLFNFERGGKVPKVPTKAIKGFVDSGGDSLIQLKTVNVKTPTPTLPSPQPVIKAAIKSSVPRAAAPGYVGGEGGLLAESTYAFGKPSYSSAGIIQTAEILKVAPEIISFSKMSMASPQSQTIELFAQPQAITKQAYLKPQTIELFAQPQAITKQSYLKPQAIELFAQPQAITRTLQQKPIQIQSILSPPQIVKPRIQTPITTPDITGFFGLPGLGVPKTGGGQRAKEKKTKGSFKAKYNPSLGSVLFRQETKKVTKEQFKLLSKKQHFGLMSRSSLEIVPDKKKKKKKK